MFKKLITKHYKTIGNNLVLSLKNILYFTLIRQNVSISYATNTSIRIKDKLFKHIIVLKKYVFKIRNK